MTALRLIATAASLAVLSANAQAGSVRLGGSACPLGSIFQPGCDHQDRTTPLSPVSSGDSLWLKAENGVARTEVYARVDGQARQFHVDVYAYQGPSIPGNGNNPAAQMWSTVSDTVTFKTEQPTALLIELHPATFDGSMAGSMAGFRAGWSSTIELHSTIGANTFTRRIDAYAHSPGFDKTTGSSTFLAQGNTPLPLTLYLYASASAAGGWGTGAFAESHVDYGNTLSWGGIKSVTDAVTGLPVVWAFASESGVRWDLASPVPEPTSALLLATGVLALALRSTGRRAWAAARVKPRRCRASCR